MSLYTQCYSHRLKLIVSNSYNSFGKHLNDFILIFTRYCYNIGMNILFRLTYLMED
jgi:hypothetical protein